ncbi:hypothetical protein K7432_009582 [Basidiobolus ranarum]|uniref:Uncharacterized protein n=1 Tax=Basidiobolus ranarum TaxID=34480 RepID=A0ABR2WPZ4_9FUNG
MKNRRQLPPSQRYLPFLTLSRKRCGMGAQDLSHNTGQSLSQPPTALHNCTHNTELRDASGLSDQTISQEAGPVATESEASSSISDRLLIDNSYLLEQNRALSRELTQAKLTAHALRQMVVKKEDEMSKVKQENRRLILKQQLGSNLTSKLTLTRSTQPQFKFFKEESPMSKEISYLNSQNGLDPTSADSQTIEPKSPPEAFDCTK